MKKFEAEWSDRLQIGLQSEQAPVGQTKYRSRTAYDERTRLHKEVVFVPHVPGKLADFLSFLEALKLPE